jgi:hypothetical protein
MVVTDSNRFFGRFDEEKKMLKQLVVREDRYIKSEKS